MIEGGNMQNEALNHFQTLKIKLQTTLQANYPHLGRSIHEWKSQEITALQEILHQKVKGYISEKWFYTHLKPLENDKLPRIDMLDMLARFVGYAGWQDFVFQHTFEKNNLPHSTLQIPMQIGSSKNIHFFLWKWLIGSVFVLIIGLSVWAMIQKQKDYEAEFCFQDADTQQSITQAIDVFLLKEGESPQLQKVNQQGCVKIRSKQNMLMMVVKAKYYQTDTIIRQINQEKTNEIIKLKKDDYALLIHLLSKQGKTEAEKKQKRKQLDKMIDEEAQIFQIDESGLGVELYSKEEFIDKLSLPISSLKNLEIIETKYQNEKIILLRFLQK